MEQIGKLVNISLWVEPIKGPNMLIDFSQIINNIDNEPIIIDDKPLTLGTACATALQNNYLDEQNLPPEKKLSRFYLALKVYKQSTPVEVTTEEIVEMKTVLNKQYGTLVYARCAPMLEGIQANYKIANLT